MATLQSQNIPRLKHPWVKTPRVKAQQGQVLLYNRRFENLSKAMITDRFFKTENVEIELQVPVEQAISNLGASVTAPGKLPPGIDNWMTGNVAQTATHIHRSVAGSRNSFRPTFYGNFVGGGQQSQLTGEITLNRIIQKFIVLWCSVVALMAIWTLVTVLRNPAASWGSLIYIVFMLGACIVFFRVMISKTSDDVAWLKQEITRSANGH